MAEPIEPPSGFYVYILYRDAAMTLPFYVGMGSGTRIQHHHGKEWRTGLRSEILRELKTELGFIPSRKIAEGLTKAAAFTLEIALIKQFGRMPDGPLVNATDGGNGASSGHTGHKHSVEAKAKISAALTGRKQPPDEIAKRAAAVSAALKGKSHPPQGPEVQAKRSASLKAYRADLKAAGRVHPGMQGKRHSSETRANMSAIAKRQARKPPMSNEIRLKMSTAQKLRWKRYGRRRHN